MPRFIRKSPRTTPVLEVLEERWVLSPVRWWPAPPVPLSPAVPAPAASAAPEGGASRPAEALAVPRSAQSAGTAQVGPLSHPSDCQPLLMPAAGRDDHAAPDEPADEPWWTTLRPMPAAYDDGIDAFVGQAKTSSAGADPLACVAAASMFVGELAREQLQHAAAEAPPQRLAPR